MFVFVLHFSKKHEEPPDWHPNKQNLTFPEVMKRTTANTSWAVRIENFKPTMFSDDVPMLDKVKREWLADPQQYRKQLEQVRMTGETKMNKTFIPGNSNSTDAMLRMNPFIRMGCEFDQIDGQCTITKIEKDYEHESLAIVKFTFDKDKKAEYNMIHRYRNPYKHWIAKKDLKVDMDLKCSKLIKKEGTACNDIEWDFPRLDWN
ncbi:Conserved_hypothetical protein [Hexamita inflata]|uniref:Uncharacterized protein n=1 Tax=Hexamita inflata TaxID=28002 RepID=A0ABP1HEF8_9EUKA